MAGKRWFLGVGLGLLAVVEVGVAEASGVRFEESVRFCSRDGTCLAANLWTPEGSGRFPAILFMNSWALEEHEYLPKAFELARNGYVVLSYSTRGFGSSQGQASLAGPRDVEDVVAALDFLQGQTAVDPERIGVSGVSLGGGLSLLAASLDRRIKAVAAISTWSDLGEVLYGGSTPIPFWEGFLLASGWTFGRVDPSVPRTFRNLVLHRVGEEELAWTRARSASLLVEKLNARGVPVYLSQNLGDDLLQPNQMMDYFERLRVPKHLDLNQGIHLSEEGFALLGITAEIWPNVQGWFDRFLKGVANGMEAEPLVTMEVSGSHTRESFPIWPLQSALVYPLKASPRAEGTIHSWVLSGASTGVPILSSLVDAHLDAPVTLKLGSLRTQGGLLLEGAPLTDDLHLRGIARLSLEASSSIGKALLMFYLYDVDEKGQGKLITHGKKTFLQARPAERVALDATLKAAAYDVPRGHHLALVIGTSDPLYGPPTLRPYSLTFAPATLENLTLTLPTPR